MNTQDQGWIEVVGDNDRVFDLDGTVMVEVIEDGIPMAELIDAAPKAKPATTQQRRLPKTRVLKAKTVAWEWQREPSFGWAGGVLRIGSTTYHISPLFAGLDWEGAGAIIGWRLTKDDGTAYDVSAEGQCDCADATYNHARPGGCKHRVNLAAALAAVGFEAGVTV